VQSVGATVLRPFEIGANRVAQPFRDAYGYFAGLVHAKSENNRLRAELDQLRQQQTLNLSASSDNASLRKQLNFVRSPSFPAGYAYVGADIVGRSPSDFEQQPLIDAGTANRIRVYDPVVTGDGLLGTITKAATDVSQLTLLTDDTSAVSAVDVQTHAIGIVREGAAGMSFDRVTKDQLVNQGDILVTAHWKLRGLTSIFPAGIPIGRVTFVGQNEVDFFKHVQLQPFANVKSVSSVLVLIPKRR
jgi:rod shape-determining protein MreC